MGKGEIVTLVLTLLTIGTAIIGALIRTIFSGMRSRIDRLEEKVEEDYKKCMEQIIALTKENWHG